MTGYTRGDVEVSDEPRPAIIDYHVVGRRIVAGLIDLVFLLVIFLVMAAFFGDLGASVAFLVIGFGYYIVWEGLAAATAGKMVMGLRVLKEDGRPCGWGHVVLRNVFRIIDGLPFSLYIVALLFIASSKKKQRIGDMAAKTLVVRA